MLFRSEIVGFNVGDWSSDVCSSDLEIWLLLHAKDQKAAIETDALIKELKKIAPVWKNYSKSAFTDTQKSFLNDNTDVAVARAKKLHEFQNPSTGIYKLIEMLKGGETQLI